MSQTGKLFITVASQLIICYIVSGQNYHFSNLHENILIHNPASITHTRKLSFQLMFRDQWPGNNDYITYDAAILYGSEALHSTAGLLFLRDVQGEGIISANYYSLLYGFKTRITHSWQFSGGIQAAYATYTANFNTRVFEDGQTPNIPLSHQISGYDFASGIEFAYEEKDKVGFSVSKIGSLLPSQSLYQGLQINFTYSGFYELNRGYGSGSFYIEPMFFSAFQRDYNELLFGSRVNFYSFLVGLYVRQNLKFQYDAIIILLGTRFGKMALFYTYDINLSGARSRFTKFAAHEVTFLYDIEYKSKSSKKGAIKCPKI